MLRRWYVLILGSALASLVPGRSFADGSPMFDKETVPVAEFLRRYSEHTGRVVLLADEVEKAVGALEITVMNPLAYRVDPDLVRESYLALLRAYDLTVVSIGPSSAPIDLVENLRSGGANAKLAPAARFVRREDLAGVRWRTELMRTVVSLRHVPIARVQSELRSLVNPQYGAIRAISSINALLITEFGPVLYAVAEMLEAMDQREAERQVILRKVPLEVLDAEELEGILESLLQESESSLPQRAAGDSGLSSGREKTKILSDPRSNSLIVSAVPEEMEKILALIENLDLPAEEVRRAFHIFPVQHALAADLVSLLETSFSAEGNRGTGGEGRRREQPLHFVADPHTNSILVYGTGPRFQEVAEKIRALDVRLSQVLIEVAVVELNRDFRSAFGVELGEIENVGGGRTRVFGATSFSDGALAFRRRGLSGGSGQTSVSVSDNVLGILRGDEFGLPVLIRTMRSEQTGHLLSRPSILTNANQSARLSIGQEIPTFQSTLAGNGVVQRSSEEYAEADLSLEITPNVSIDGSIRLAIDLSVDSFLAAASSDPDDLPPGKAIRRLSTEFTVPDGSTIVLGGLKQTTDSVDVQKVPILGDLPILGALFRREDRLAIETNLYLFLSPKVLDEPDFEDLRDLSREREAEVERLIGDRVHDIGSFLSMKSAGSSGATARRSSLGKERLTDFMDRLVPFVAYRSPTDRLPE